MTTRTGQITNVISAEQLVASHVPISLETLTGPMSVCVQVPAGLVKDCVQHGVKLSVKFTPSYVFINVHCIYPSVHEFPPQAYEIAGQDDSGRLIINSPSSFEDLLLQAIVAKLETYKRNLNDFQ